MEKHDLAPITSPVVTYTSAATAGELLSYTVDTTNLTYSYTIINSQYGLTGKSGSGTLVDNGDGTYSPKDAPNAKIVMVQNGMIIGAVRLNINGIPRVIPLIGFSNLITSLTEAQDTYNYVERVCSDSTRTLCGSTYGTFRVNADGTWVSCDKADYTADAMGCSGQIRTSGTLNALGNGEWQVLDSNSTAVGTGLAFKASNGQKVWVVDLSLPTASDGFGIGIVAGSSQASITSADTDGTWIFSGTTGSLQYAGTLTVSSDTYTAAGFILSGVGALPFGGTRTITDNTPWTGFVQGSGGGTALLAGTGMYAAVNPSLGTIEVGLRK